MSTCPEQVDLYAYVDGELARPQWQSITDHLPSCSRCRDEIRSIGRLNRELHRREPMAFADDYEDAFKAALMARMVTSDEVKTFRRVMNARRLAYAAAGVLIAVLSWTFFKAPVPAGSRPVSPVAAVTPGGEAVPYENAFGRLVAAVRRSGALPDEHAVRKLERAFASGGRSLVGHVASELEQADEEGEQALYRILGAADSTASRSLLKRHLDQSEARHPSRRVILDAMVERPGPGTARVVARQARKHLAFREACRLLAKIPGSAAMREMEELCRTRLKSNSAEVIDVLVALDTPWAEDLLFALHMEGVQSEALTAHLVSRRTVIEKSRRLLRAPYTASEKRRRAIRLLGEKRDQESAAMLEQLAVRDELQQDALAALSRIGTEDVMLSLAHRLPDHVSLRRRPRPGQERVEAAVRALGEGAAPFFAAQARTGDKRHRTRYVQALALVGGNEALPHLYELADDPELRPVVVVTVTRIGSRSSISFLKRMLKDRRGSVRRAAREGLKSLAPRKSAPTWKGFARSDGAPCRIIPSMV